MTPVSCPGQIEQRNSADSLNHGLDRLAGFSNTRDVASSETLDVVRGDPRRVARLGLDRNDADD